MPELGGYKNISRTVMVIGRRKPSLRQDKDLPKHMRIPLKELRQWVKDNPDKDPQEARSWYAITHIGTSNA